jgi:hypothetical protein
MVLDVVETFYSANESWIFINRVFTAERHTPMSVLTSPTYVATTPQG